MKKIIFTLLMAFSISFVFSSCTEEEVAPRSANYGGNGTTPNIIIVK